MNTSPFIAALQCGIFRAVLAPDSRGYVQFHLERQSATSTSDFLPLTSQDVMTCEHLTDLCNVSLDAMQWITQFCDELTAEDGTHLYFKFREEQPDDRPISRDPGGSDTAPSGGRPGFAKRLSQALRALGNRG